MIFLWLEIKLKAAKSHLVVEEFLEGEPGPGHAVVEAVGLLVADQPLHGLKGLHGLAAGQLQGGLDEVGLLAELHHALQRNYL